MAPRPVASALQSEEEEQTDSFPLAWILAIVFNVLFIICLFVVLIYCIKRRKKKLLDQTEEIKPSPIFRRRTISQSFGAANFQFSTPSSAGSFRTNSSSSKKSKKSNRVANVEMVNKVQTKEQIESNRPISPVRYDSPGPPKPLSSVFTIQQESTNLDNQTNDTQLSVANQLADELNGSARKASLTFKNLAIMQTRLSSEMSDSRVKIKAMEFDELSDHSDSNEENSKKTINNDIESLDSTEVINDENDSIQSLTLSGDEQTAGEKKHRDKKTDQTDQEKDELIEQLSLQMIKEQSVEQNLPPNSHPTKLNNSEAELTYVSDSGLGDSQANLSSVAHLTNLPTSTHVPNTHQAAISVAATAANTSTSILGANQQIKSNVIDKQLTRLDSFSNANKMSTSPVKESPAVQVGSVKEFSFSQTTRADKQNESGVIDRPLHELQSSSKAISRHDSKKSRNGSAGKRNKRMKSAGVQTTPSLRRSTPQPRPVQNKESTFSAIYTDIASKLDPSEQAEQQANMQPIEEENFCYNPEVEQQERKYFIYLISDTSNPYYKKDCIGKILLPTRGQLTLSELRDQLFKQSEDSVKTILKKGKNFRFLTETYRFVSQNESIASVKEVYPTQGIFLKLNSSDNPVAYGRPKNAKSDLTNLINAALNESSAGGKSPHSGINMGANKAKQINVKAYNKDLSNLNREAAAIGDIPRVHLSKPEQENSQSFSPQSLLSANTPSFRSDYPDQRSAVLREALFRRHGPCLFSQPIIRSALPKQVVVKGELTKRCQSKGCSLIAILKCVKCGRAFYCSIEHKRENWPEHKTFCKRPPWRL